MINHITVNGFEDNDLETFTNFFNYMENNINYNNIIILINSNGGDIYNALAMTDLIDSCSKPVITIGMSKVYSAATLLLASGTNRYVLPSSSIMMHNISISNVSGMSKNIEGELGELKRCNKIYYEKFDKYTNSKKGTFKSILKNNLNDIYMSPKTALEKYHLTDNIGMPDLELYNTESTEEIEIE